MSRRGTRAPGPRRSRSVDRTESRPTWLTSANDASGDDLDRATYLGERLRRLALGATAALVTARAFWPSEPEMRLGAGGGMTWVLALLIAFGLAVAASLIGGWFRFRWSSADLMVVLLMLLVALSANHAIERRPAINLAWEWAGFGLTYVLFRNLPRTRGESSALAGAFVATAFAVSCYGLYQVKVELPVLQAAYLRDPVHALEAVGIAPGGRGELLFRDRLLGSIEPFSTFGLANSLAGFIVGPLVILLGVGIQNLSRRAAAGSRWMALAMAGAVAFVILVCLIWTKSRSAWLGLLVATGVLAWQARGQLSTRARWGAGLIGLALVGTLAVASAATGRLDMLVLTESAKSLRYRWEYWQGAWGVITDGAASWRGIWNAPTFWYGVGPGNFGGPYLLHKLPEASEEILDPHNLFLEVWATGGVWALAALVIALLLGLRNTLGRAPGPGPSDDLDLGRHPIEAAPAHAEDAAPRHAGWLIAYAGAGWIAVLLVGGLNPFQGDLFFRWLILGGSWLLAVVLGAPLWRRLPLPAATLGAATLCMLVNLTAAGGIGIPAVALAFWLLFALGLNLRDDLGCGRLREHETRMVSVGLAFVWVALLGSFIGGVRPYWRAEAAIAAAQDAIARKPPDLEGADRAYQVAITADRYYARPWLGLANLETLIWESRGAKLEDQRWRKIPILLEEAVKEPRNPNSWSLHRERGVAIHRLLAQIGQRLGPRDQIRYKGAIVEAMRKAALNNPTSAELHATLAEASADISMLKDAADEAKEALRLDSLTPHIDRKLPAGIRKRLEAQLPKWSEGAATMNLPTQP